MRHLLGSIVLLMSFSTPSLGILIDDFETNGFTIQETFDLAEGEMDRSSVTYELSGNSYVRSRRINTVVRGPGDGGTFVTSLGGELQFTYGRNQPGLTSDLFVTWSFTDAMDLTELDTLFIDFGTYLVPREWDATLSIGLDGRGDYVWEVPYDRWRRDWRFTFPQIPEEVFQLRLGFKNLGTFNDGYYVGVDSVSLIPEPTAATLVTVGMIGCLVGVRRRRLEKGPFSKAFVDG